MRFNYIFIFAIISVIIKLSACNPQPEANKLLYEAQRLVESHPDSALKLIDSIFYPEKSFNKRNYMNYLMVRVQARHKNYIDISRDTTIFIAYNYFKRQSKDPAKTSLAAFYGGNVYREQNNFEKAMELYKDADYYALQAKDCNLNGLISYNIADLLTGKGLYEQALNAYKNANSFYTRSDKNTLKEQAQCHSAIGRMYFLTNKLDSALISFNKGWVLADKSGDKNLQGLLLQNLSVAYLETQQYQQAEEYLRKSFSLENDSIEIFRYYLNFAELFHKAKKNDSTYYYAKKLKTNIDKITDSALKASVYNFFIEREKEQLNYKEALFYQNKLTTVIKELMTFRLSQSVYEIQKKYDFEKMQNHYDRKYILYQRWIIFLLVISIITGIFFMLYRTKQKTIREQTLQKIDTLKEMNRDLESLITQKNIKLRKDILWRFDISKKVLAINKEISNSLKNTHSELQILSKVNSILYGKQNIDEQWKPLFNIFNETLPGFTEKLMAKYPTLTELEFRICLLTYVGFQIKEIAVILDLKPNTIQTRRTQLRKKIQIKQGWDFSDFIDRNIYDQT